MAKKKVDPDEDYSIKEQKAGLFDILKNITEEKVNRWVEFEKGYTPYMINRFLSMQPDLMHYANEMNKSTLSNREQYEFYLYVLPKRRRYFKYIKASPESELSERISELIKVNKSKAKCGAKILNKLHEDL